MVQEDESLQWSPSWVPVVRGGGDGTAQNGPMTVMLFTKRGLQPDAVTYQFSTKFGAQLETGTLSPAA